MAGTDGAQTINGLNGADDIAGGSGADTLNGGNGQDFVAGDNGADTINGGAGNDFLVGGNGADTFVISEGSGFDAIADFGTGNDRIDLSDFEYDSFDQLNLVEQNGSTFIFIDENTSVELQDVDIEDLSADAFIL